MPQVISVERGSVSIPSSSNTTIFTNSSSGIATRVIINYLTIYYGSNQNSFVRGYLGVQRSGITNYIGFMSNNSNANTIRALYAFPADNGQMNNGTQGSGSTVGFLSTGDLFDVQQFSYNGSTNYGANCIPKNFWISPGDVVAFGFKPDSGNTATLYYSFTLIRED